MRGDDGNGDFPSRSWHWQPDGGRFAGGVGAGGYGGDAFYDAGFAAGGGVEHGSVAARRFRIADGSGLEYGVGAARLRIDDREEVCPVIFGPEGQYLLGATTLEIFELTVDPTAPNPHLAPAGELYL